MTAALPPLLQRVQEAGHVVFADGLLNLNVVAVRSPSRVAGRFDDRLFVVYRDERGWVTRSWAVTTDPGAYYSENPLNPLGTARLMPGQYRGSHVIGKHKGRYPALVQDRPVTVFRDPDGDRELEDVGRDSGLFGINIHASDGNPFDTRDQVRTDVGRWSAGCIVFASSSEYREWWTIVTLAAQRWGRRFTLTLLED